jgi:phosphatidylethanolamine/phosphatidyl-N-methylethanolamine N-methyltransferase
MPEVSERSIFEHYKIMTRRIRQNVVETAQFVRQCLSKPKQMGAIAPSSRGLAQAMARWVSADPKAVVLELGPGTGSITEALMARGLSGDRLLAIEKSPELAVLLQKRFPSVRVIEGDAWDLEALMEKHVDAAHHVGAVISSLPLRRFKPEATEALARKIRAVLRPGACWVQYSYHLGNDRPLGTGYFELVSTNVVWLNLPPARVSVYQKPLTN